MIRIVASNYAYVELLNSTVRKFEEDFPFVGKQCRVVYAAKFTKAAPSSLWGRSYFDGRIVLDVTKIDPDRLQHVVVHELFHQLECLIGSWSFSDLPLEVLVRISPAATDTTEGYTELLTFGYLGTLGPDSMVFDLAREVLEAFTTMCGQI